jgi:hypothetical protein
MTGAIALCVALALALSACSSTKHPKPSFVSSYRSAESAYRTQLGALQQQAPALVGQDVSKQLSLIDGMSSATTTAVTALKKLTPPANVAGLYTQLMTLLTRQQTTLGQIETAARASDQAGLNSSLSGYATDLQTGISLLHQIDDGLAASPGSSPRSSPSA